MKYLQNRTITGKVDHMWTKTIALLTSICFLVSFICAPAVEGAIDIAQESKLKGDIDAAVLAPPLPFGIALPSSIGRVTGYTDCGSDVVVVNIQDLHCNAEVQRNISKIITSLTAQYRLDGIYLEGGYGSIDTSWITNISDSALMKDLAEIMIDQGYLTGAEYYAITNHCPGLLRGMEDEQLHKSNIQRLGKILANKAYVASKISELDRDIAFLQAKYFSSRNRRFNTILKRNRSGRMPADKYYALLRNYVDKINSHPTMFNNLNVITMSDYPNLQNYTDVLRIGQRLPYQRISRQLKQVVEVLKMKLPYSEYNRLFATSGHFSNDDVLYRTLPGLCDKYNIDLSNHFSDLRNFFVYVQKQQQINPLQMIREEKRLIEAIRISFSRDIAELEVAFLVDFYEYYKDYIGNRIAADDLAYFSERIDKFKTIWSKYTYANRLADFEPVLAPLKEYYDINVQRNDTFINNILNENTGKANMPEKTAGQLSSSERNESYANNGISSSAKSIVVVVAGGFHTTGLDRLLIERKISQITITPMVTQDIHTSVLTYERLLQEQATVDGRLTVPGNSVSSTKPSLSSCRELSSNDVTSSPVRWGNCLINGNINYINALALTVIGSKQGMEQVKPLIRAVWQRLRQRSSKLGVNELKGMIDTLGFQNRINVMAKGGDTQLVITSDNSETVVFNITTGEFEETTDKVTEARLPGVASMSEAAESAVDACVLFAEWMMRSGSMVCFAPLLERLILTGAQWAAGNNYMLGEGLIVALANDRDLLQQILSAQSCDEQRLGQLYPQLQEALVNEKYHAKIVAELLRSNQSTFIKALVTIPEVSNLIRTLAATRLPTPDSMRINVPQEKQKTSGGYLHEIRELYSALKNMKSKTIITPDSHISRFIHSATVVIFAITLLCFYYTTLPLLFVPGQSVVGTFFMLGSILVMPILWPSMIQRLLIVFISSIFYDAKYPKESIPVIPDEKLPFISIIFPMRNEPAGVVIPRLQALLETLDYPRYEIIVTDNSDIEDDQGAVNEDFAKIYTFVRRCQQEYGKDKIQFIRRGQGENSTRFPELRRLGDKTGGKAENVNEAIRNRHMQQDLGDEHSIESSQWSFILDSDSTVPPDALRKMVSVAVDRSSSGSNIGFVQSVFTSDNPNENLLTFAQSAIDSLFYQYFFPVKASAGAVSNWGHGVLISNAAWAAAGGIPYDISEDLSFANNLQFLERWDNIFVLVPTGEEKPTTWDALKIQRNRWSEGTTQLVIKQLHRIWSSSHYTVYEKMDLTYDMTTYILTFIGIVLTIFQTIGWVLGYSTAQLYMVLMPLFYVSLVAENVLLPVLVVKAVVRKDWRDVRELFKSMPAIALTIGAISVQSLFGVWSAISGKKSFFQVTPKGKQDTESILRLIKTNKFSIFLGVLWIYITLNAYEPLRPFMITTPFVFLFGPILNPLFHKFVAAIRPRQLFSEQGIDNENEDAKQEAGTLPENIWKFYKEIERGRTLTWAYWVVHGREIGGIAFARKQFKQAHPFLTDQLSRSIDLWHTVFWVASIAVFGLMSGIGYGLLALAPFAGFGVLIAGIPLSVLVGFMMSGALHTRYNKDSSVPIVVGVAMKEDLPEDIKVNIIAVSEPSYIARLKTAQPCGIKNTFITRDDNVVIIYVMLQNGENFDMRANEILNLMQGTGNISGSIQFNQQLKKIGCGSLIGADIIVLRAHADGVSLQWREEELLLPARGWKVDYAQARNILRARHEARKVSVAIERDWTDDFKAMERIDRSIVLPADHATPSHIQILHDKGSKVYIQYHGIRCDEAQEILTNTKADGIICPEMDANALQSIRAGVYTGAWVAGKNSDSNMNIRAYTVVDLSIGPVSSMYKPMPWSVVKILLTKDTTPSELKSIVAQIDPTCIVIFEKENFLQAKGLMTHDITEIYLFGVNIFELFITTPREKAEYEYQVAFNLEIASDGMFEMPASDNELKIILHNILAGNFNAIHANKALVSAAQLHAATTDDRQSFLRAFAARYLLASHGKIHGLASPELEYALIQMMSFDSVDSLDTHAALALVPQTMIAADVEKIVCEAVRTWKQGAVATIPISLIILFAESRTIISIDRMRIAPTDPRLSRKILEAA